MRLLDTGVRSGRRNIALDQALIDGHDDGTSPATLRWLEFEPSVLVGRHQDLSREVDLDYCHANGIDVGRRVTGGGAIYLDRHQLGWELICPRRWLDADSLVDVAATICTAMAGALNDAGIEARYRPRNDLEVEGRKIGGTGGFFTGDTVFYQGTLLLTVDGDAMFSALRVPAEKHRAGGGGAAARVTDLRTVCGGTLPPLADLKSGLAEAFCRRLGFSLAAGALSAAETASAQVLYRDEIGTAEFIHAIDGLARDGGWLRAHRTTAGGHLFAHVRCWPGRDVVQQVLLSGDVFVTPPRLVYDLESALKDTPLAALDARVRRFVAAASVGLMSFSADDVVAVIESALATRGVESADA